MLQAEAPRCQLACTVAPCSPRAGTNQGTPEAWLLRESRLFLPGSDECASNSLWRGVRSGKDSAHPMRGGDICPGKCLLCTAENCVGDQRRDRKSTRLNSSHSSI